MAERVDLPSDLWLKAKLLFDPLMTDHHVIDHVVVSRTRLIMHRPASIYELQLAVFNKSFHSFFHRVVLIVPPHFEEFHLHLGESSLRVGLKRPHDIGEHNIDLSAPLSAFIRPEVILVNLLQPPNIIVGVRDNVDVDLTPILFLISSSTFSRKVVLVVLAKVFGYLMRNFLL